MIGKFLPHFPDTGHWDGVAVEEVPNNDHDEPGQLEPEGVLQRGHRPAGVQVVETNGGQPDQHHPLCVQNCPVGQWEIFLIS